MKRPVTALVMIPLVFVLAYAGGLKEESTDADSHATESREGSGTDRPQLPEALVNAATEDYGKLDLDRLVSAGGAITEIIFRLGEGEHVVAVDTSSVYPPQEVRDLPKIGYVRQLSAEGVLSMNPSVVLTIPDIGPRDVVTQIHDAGVPVLAIPSEDTLQGAKRRIRVVSDIFGKTQEAERIVGEIERNIAHTRSYVERVRGEEPVEVMFIYARGAGTVMASGSGTSAAAVIELAGAVNAVQGYSGYKPLTPEAAVNAQPDVLLFTAGGLESLGGEPGIGDIPGLAQTPAYREGRIVAMEDLYLLGFGPRLGEAVYDLARTLYPEQ